MGNQKGIQVEVDKLPPCDLCKTSGSLVEAAYDAKTKQGPWAFMCERHYAVHSMYPSLGTGKGQRLIERTGGRT